MRAPPAEPPESALVEELRDRLETVDEQDRFICQSSRLENATQPLSRWKRLTKCYREVRVGNRSLIEMVRLLGSVLCWKMHGLLFGRFPRGTQQRTPREVLNLHSKELIEVKSYPEILATLDEHGRNRGLVFDLEMKQYCGNGYFVNRRLDRMIREDNGRLLDVRNTVILDQVDCQCVFATGGCPRAEPPRLPSPVPPAAS